MFVLDSDILTLLFAGHSQVLRRRNQVSSADIATSIVSRIQSLLGRFQFLLKAASGAELLRAQRLLDGTLLALTQIETVFGINDTAAAEFDWLRQNKKLKKIGRSDLLIAAITLANHATLVTRNLKDFRQVPNLRVEIGLIEWSRRRRWDRPSGFGFRFSALLGFIFYQTRFYTVSIEPSMKRLTGRKQRISHAAHEEQN